MSFSKAKIQRFNDKQDSTPSPANYTIKTSDKVKFGVIGKQGKTPKKPGSIVSSENASVRSGPSSFLTPTALPKKKKILGLSFKSSSKPTENEELRERIVECNNKDLYIRDLVEQIDEMTTKINDLTKENTALKTESSKLESCNNQVKELRQSLLALRSFYTNTKDTIEAGVIKQIVEKLQLIGKEVEVKDETIQKLEKSLRESLAKIAQLEENYREIQALNDIQTSQRILDLELAWSERLEVKEKESEAILKECQEISEYNIIECEVEKNQWKNICDETNQLLIEAQACINNLKAEKHAYELSLNTFKDTIEVLKRRLISSDQDVVQLKTELEESESKVLSYEAKCGELKDELNAAQVVNEDLEIQYESNCKITRDEIEQLKTKLLAKVEALEAKAPDQSLLEETLTQCHDQQALISNAQATLADSEAFINKLETEKVELEQRVQHEATEAAEMRRKYIETSGKYDELAHQFEQLLQELDQGKTRIEELEAKLVPFEKLKLENEAFAEHYAELAGHQNPKQKLKYLHSLRIKSSELSDKNEDLEASNLKLNKTVDKLRSELEQLKKPTKNKENIASPIYKKVQSPGPLKERN